MISSLLTGSWVANQPKKKKKILVDLGICFSFHVFQNSPKQLFILTGECKQVINTLLTIIVNSLCTLFSTKKNICCCCHLLYTSGQKLCICNNSLFIASGLVSSAEIRLPKQQNKRAENGRCLMNLGDSAQRKFWNSRFGAQTKSFCFWVL